MSFPNSWPWVILLYGSSTHVTTTCPCWPGWLIWEYIPPATGTYLIVLLHRKHCKENYSVLPHLFAPRSLKGTEEVPADADMPEQEETKGEEEVKEDDETQQQRVDEEVQSIQGSEGRKVGWNQHLADLVMFSFLFWTFPTERSQSTVGWTREPSTDPDGGTRW